MNDYIIPLILFSFSMCATPGPNNVMLTASGANFGLRRTIPHILGVDLGLMMMICLSGFGLGLLFHYLPFLQGAIKLVSICYLFYLALRLALTDKKGGKEGEEGGRPLNMVQAMLFQLVNPKVLVMSVSAISTFTVAGEGYVKSVLVVVVVFGLVCMPSVSMWACFGTIIGRFLQGRSAFRLFNVTMGLLTAASVVQII